MRTFWTTAVSAVSLCLVAGLAQGQTFTVDTLNDVSDAQTDGFGVPDLPGPDGRVSFREALAAVNNLPGPQTIEFAIPQDEWWLVSDMAVLRLENGAFLVTDDETTIDFSSQTDFSGDTNPSGTELGIYGLQPNGWGVPAIIVQADDCVFRGLGKVWQRGTAISIWAGHRNRVVGCTTTDIEIDPYPEHSTFNTIGGVAPEDGNTLESISMVCGADDNVVIGNRVKTIFVGASPYCDTSSRNRIGGPTPAERNVINGFGRYSGEGFPTGEGIKVSWATDTLIEGNYIGVNEAGTERVSQVGPSGIEVNDSDQTTIRNNLIAGLRVVGVNHYSGQTFGRGIMVNAINRDNLGVVIEGNLIGTDYTGQNRIQTLNGIVVSQFTGIYTPHDVTIGGTEPGQGNLIAFCDVVGVGIGPLIEDAVVSGNSIHSNSGVGIDLSTWTGWDGVTPNDAGDEDTRGGNELQNFPVLSSAEVAGSSVHVEGETFLGWVDVTTDANGDAAIDATLSASVPSGSFISATATDLAASATSEFAACVEAVGNECGADFDGDGTVNSGDVLAFLNAWTSQLPSGDFDGDGLFNSQDVLAFLNMWTAGC